MSKRRPPQDGQGNLFGLPAEPAVAPRKKPRRARPKARGAKLEAAFWRFHTDNAHVYVILIRLAREWLGRHGPRKLGVAMLFERARWDIAMQTTDALGFKLNNNHRAFYARLIMQHEPDLADVFQLRRQRFQATIGPSNAGLPASDHQS